MAAVFLPGKKRQADSKSKAKTKFGGLAARTGWMKCNQGRVIVTA